MFIQSDPYGLRLVAEDQRDELARLVESTVYHIFMPQRRFLPMDAA
jgi:hypothetical protein